jgi:hypothetical protein
MASLKDKLSVHKTNVQARLGEKFGVIADEVERVRGVALPAPSFEMSKRLKAAPNL